MREFLVKRRLPVAAAVLVLVILAIWSLSSQSTDVSVAGASDDVIMPLVVEAPEKSASSHLMLECKAEGLPATIPPDGVVPVWEIKDRPEAHTSIGLYIGTPGSTVSVGNRKLGDAHACMLATRGAGVVSDILFAFPLAFSKTLEQANGKDAFEPLSETRAISIPKVSAGKPFVFWVANGTHGFVRLTLPNKAKVYGQGKAEVVQVLTPRTSQFLLRPM
jgi:hypothetical protein